jgi:hypothetical protein
MFASFELATDSVVGYHGTTAEVAAKILSGSEPFQSSTEEHHWLGSGGVYFYQDGPGLARQWARWKIRHDPSIGYKVIGAKITLQNCIDLIDIHWWPFVKDIYQALLHQCMVKGVQMPVQIERQLYEAIWSYRDKDGKLRADPEEIGKSWLDCAILDLLRKKIFDNGHERVKTVRSLFSDGKRVYRKSNFFELNRVEILVIDKTLIGDPWDAT